MIFFRTCLVAQMVKSRMHPLQSKVLPYGRPGFNPWIGRFPWGEGKGYLLQYSGLEKFMDYMGSQRVGMTEPLSPYTI